MLFQVLSHVKFFHLWIIIELRQYCKILELFFQAKRIFSNTLKPKKVFNMSLSQLVKIYQVSKLLLKIQRSWSQESPADTLFFDYQTLVSIYKQTSVASFAFMAILIRSNNN